MARTLADLPALLQTNRNVLEVRELAAEPSCGGNGLPVIGMHLTGLWPHLFQQSFDVRRLQLGKLTVVQNLPDHFVVGREALQHLGICRVAGLVFFKLAAPASRIESRQAASAS